MTSENGKHRVIQGRSGPMFRRITDLRRDLRFECEDRVNTCQRLAASPVLSDCDTEHVVFQGFEGVQLVVDVRGSPDDWPVLFLHGGGHTRHAWGKTADVIASHGWRTITLDLRGHGESEWVPSGDYSFTSFSPDCIFIVDQLGRPPVPPTNQQQQAHTRQKFEKEGRSVHPSSLQVFLPYTASRTKDNHHES
jgi:hypothetical protein